jgi:hypothetical protein
MGFPPRPDPIKDPDHYQAWQKLVAIGFNRIDPEMIPTSRIHGNVADNIWSGAVMNGNPTYISAYAEWSVPAIADACCFAQGTASFWIGLDGGAGGASNDVIQDGVDLNEIPLDGGLAFKSYDAWIEWYPNTDNIMNGFPVSPGDHIESEVWVGDQNGLFTTAGPYGWFWMHNITANAAFITKLSIPAGVTFIGNTAEFIVERPGYYCLFCGGYAPDLLADFNVGAIGSIAAWGLYDQAPHNLSTDPYMAVDMVNQSNGHRLSTSVVIPPSLTFFFWQNYE